MQKHVTNVIDAGGRYGMHPTWAAFEKEICYSSFEPDAVEAKRLQKKYEANNQVIIVPGALGREKGNLTLNRLKHNGQSSAFQPNDKSVWFEKTRIGEGEVVGKFQAPMTTIDDYASERGLAIDFLKIDTEGSEFEILKGAEGQLTKNIIGLRCEVHFDTVFHGVPMFGEIHAHLFERGFQLVNLDYDGRGAFVNGMCADRKYGYLISTDGIWLKRKELFFHDFGNDPAANAYKVLKVAAFCFNNNAQDIAVDYLVSGKKDARTDFEAVSDSYLFSYVKNGFEKLFYQLKNSPYHKEVELEILFKSIFCADMKQMHEFYQSDTAKV